jgi:hypothetical protein
MKPRPFSLSLTASEEEIGVATFCTLKAAAWVLYNAGLIAFVARGEDIKTLDAETKLRLARASFNFVAEELPDQNPFRRELERYADEALADDLKGKPMAPMGPPF